jgi:hypothetical protein
LTSDTFVFAGLSDIFAALIEHRSYKPVVAEAQP